MKHTDYRPVRRRFASIVGPAAALCMAFAASAGEPGAPDPGFGSGGWLTTDFGGGVDRIEALAALRDGRLLAAGTVTGDNQDGSGTSANFAVARYLADGSLDPGFADGGLFSLDIGGGTDTVRAISVLSGGRILLGGSLTTQSYADFGLARLTPDGDLDPTFGESDGMGARTGYVRLDIGGAQVHDDAAAIAVQSTGKIVLAGMTGVQQGNFSYRRIVLARFTAEGDVDPTFGGGGTGRVVLPMFYAPGEGNDELTSIALDQGGHLPSGDGLTIVGHTLGRNNAFVARLTADGAFDGGFGTPLDGGGRSGYVLFEASHAGGVQRGVSTIAGARILRDGKIAIVGSGDDRGLTFLRLHADGSLDPDFAEDGRVTIKFSGPAEFDEPAALALQGNGKLVAAGYATSRATGTPHTDFFVARVLADGAIDTAFGDGLGRAVVQVSTFEDAAFALAVEPSGNLVAGGDAQAGSSVDFDFALTRLFGDPDRIFQGTFQSGF